MLHLLVVTLFVQSIKNRVKQFNNEMSQNEISMFILHEKYGMIELNNRYEEG